jgi:para-nitrobenzyl esterase
MIIFCVSNTALGESLCTEPVETAAGKVRGESDEDTETCRWRGIPYAAPPVGELRWRSPRPHPAWPGVRDANEFGDRCMQKGFAAWLIRENEIEKSEDCLYLNVWRPAKSGSFPVMLWIHGGGYTIGAASDYEPDRLAAGGDVVVVTINYRLNIFGFFAHPALRAEDPNRATGGQAILDMVAALEWVQDNIENFGGDPGNVTIFGESAGGAAVCTLMATPLARGLFHRAILESGGCGGGNELEDGYAFAKATAVKLGCGPEDMDCLRDAPAKKLLDISGGALGLGGYSPHYDGHLLTGSPLLMIEEGIYNQVPFMVGYNKDEAAGLLKLLPHLRHTRPKKYGKRLEKMGFSETDAARITELYPLSEFEDRPVEAYGRMFAVDSMSCGEYKAIMAAAGRQDGVYFYQFDFDDHNYGEWLGAFHGLEILFIYDHLEGMYHLNLFNDDNFGPADDLAGVVQGYWVNFAHNGDPNGKNPKDGSDLPQWPEFKTNAPTVQILDTPTRSESAATIAERCEFWEEWAEEGRPGMNVMERMR